MGNSAVSNSPNVFEWRQEYTLDGKLKEDRVWDKDIKPLLAHLPKNVQEIWYYSVTEMLNNAIDHSEGTRVGITVASTADATTRIWIGDNGIGIFHKIQKALDLDDEGHALLELTKGKLTTNAQHHSGEGVFFTSKAVDECAIHAGNITYYHQTKTDHMVEFEELDRNDTEAWSAWPGTIVCMKLSDASPKVLKDVFDTYTTEHDGGFAFDKTVVPMRLAQNGNDMLMSRSQAKRVVARIENFRVVRFDFAGIEEIGQAFTDEIFRVFKNAHPEITLETINVCDQVQKMIRRAGAAVNTP